MKSLFTYPHIASSVNSKFYPLFSVFRFTSLIRVSAPVNYKLLETTKVSTESNRSSRLLSKRSYLVFAWLKYLTILNSEVGKFWRVRIVMLPATKSFYTITKAPMAHKTRSKEQFVFKFYHFAITFKEAQPLLVSSLTFSTGSLAYILILTKQLFPVFETNILYLKYYKVQYRLKESHFFCYH